MELKCVSERVFMRIMIEGQTFKSELLFKGREVGFSLIGITTAEPVNARSYLEDAIEAGRTADMRWLARNPKRRCDPASLLPGAKSVICCALAYGEGGFTSHESRVTSHTDKARFARGADYHIVVKEKLKALWSFIKERRSDVRAKLCVDTSPILEKALAQRAGLGWIGKHSILLNEELGSWFMLGEIITDIDIEPDMPAENKCGDCSKCIDACPTKALVKAWELDARKCISYLTIELPRIASPGHESRVTGYEYGCDLCQEVCPYNSKML